MKDLDLPSLKARGFSVVQVGREGSDCVLNENAQGSPVLSTRRTEIGEAIPPPVLGKSGQQMVQLEPWKVERVGMFAVCKHFMVRLSLPGKWGWRLRLRVLFFLRLMVHM